MREKNCNYFESRGQDAVLKLRAIIKEMPDFVTDFFVGIESSTSPLTRLNYAYDLRLFFDYLKKDTPLFDGKKIKDFCVEDLNKIQSKHIERFISYLTRYEIDGKIFINNERGKARKLSTLKSFFKYFFNKDLINSNVASKVIMPKLHNKPIVKLEADEVSRLLYVAEEGVNLNNRQKAFHSHTKVRDVAILSLLRKSAPISSAIARRASSISGMTLPPKEWMLEGFPYRSVKNGSIFSTTSGATLVVALLSR